MHLPHALATEPAHPAANATLHGGWLVAARTIWVVVTILAVGLFLAATPAYVSRLNSPDAAIRAALARYGIDVGIYALFQVGADVIVALAFCAVGALVFWRKSDERLALFVAFMLVSFGTQHNTDALAAALPAWSLVIAFLGSVAWAALGLFLYTFPDGRFIPGWTSPLVAVWVLGDLPALFFPAWPLNGPSPLGQTLALVLWLGALLTQIYRYRRVSSAVERQQTKWLVFGFASVFVAVVVLLALGTVVPSLARPDSLYQLLLDPVTKLVFLPIPLALGIAVLRKRLWDIDPIINRTLVYGGLTASIVGMYVLIVGYLSTVVRTSGNLAISLLATGIVAVLFQPLRERVQRGVNRLMYGERDEPYTVLTRLGHRLEGTFAPEAVLTMIVETLREALKLPYAAIALERDGAYSIAVASGTTAHDLLCLPLSYQHETVGELLLAPRAPGEAFSTADRQLLADLARQAGVAIHAVRLTAELQLLTTDLQHSREQLVTTREEERRRLRRDLHDGLGPALAGFSLTVGAVRNLLLRDPAAADRLLAQLGNDIEAAVGDIKRLVYNLRPPALDELGLVGAIRARATHDGAVSTGNSLHIRVEAPDELPPLPAAVEVAAYRIVQEALTNVVRHAQAHECLVRLSCGQALYVEISDDGIGLNADGMLKQHTGVGLLSMHERAAELGGRCVVETGGLGGALVRAWLPLGASNLEGLAKE
jgi:signal transduction histidine kinase